MGLFDKVLNREATSAPAQEDAAKGATFGYNAIMVGGKDSALSVAACHRAVELRAKTMSQLVMEYQTIDRQGGNFIQAFRGPAARKINYLLQVRPNRLMTWSTLMQQAEIKKLLEGNAVIYIERYAGELDALWLCSTASYDQMSDKYTISWNGIGGMHTATVPSSDVLHIKNTYTRNDGLWGISTLSFARQSLSIQATADKLTLDNAAKGGKMKLLVQEEKKPGTFGLGRAGKKELEKITEQLNEDIYNKDVVLLNNVAGATVISQSNQAQELLSSRQFGVREIARLFGVPPVLLMDDSNSSYKSPEAATQEFLLRTISPAIREWENEMNAKLIGEDNWMTSRYHLCEKSLMRLDPVGQANIDKAHLETGVMSVNELRAQYDLPMIDGGDIHYISTNLAEVGSAKLRGESEVEPNTEGVEDAVDNA